MSGQFPLGSFAFSSSGLLAEHLWNSSEKTNHRGGEDSPLYLLMHVLAVCISQERVTSGQCLRLRLKHDRVMKRMKTAFDEKTRRAGEREEEDGKILVVSKKSQQKDLSLPNFRPFLPLLPDKVEQASQAYNDLVSFSFFSSSSSDPSRMHEHLSVATYVLSRSACILGSESCVRHWYYLQVASAVFASLRSSRIDMCLLCVCLYAGSYARTFLVYPSVPTSRV